jgi:hypothetical protein
MRRFVYLAILAPLKARSHPAVYVLERFGNFLDSGGRSPFDYMGIVVS